MPVGILADKHIYGTCIVLEKYRHLAYDNVLCLIHGAKFGPNDTDQKTCAVNTILVGEQKESSRYDYNIR